MVEGSEGFNFMGAYDKRQALFLGTSKGLCYPSSLHQLIKFALRPVSGVRIHGLFKVGPPVTARKKVC